jgi:hypothetical protein
MGQGHCILVRMAVAVAVAKQETCRKMAGLLHRDQPDIAIIYFLSTFKNSCSNRLCP